MFKTDGIVLRSRDIGRSTRVITVLTRDFGVVDAFANGAMRAKSKLVAVAQPLAYSDFIFKKNREYTVVVSGETKHIFYSIREDIEKLSLAFYICEITGYYGTKEGNSEEFLRLFLNTMDVLEKQGDRNKVIKALYELRLLSIAGYMPNLVACESCGSYEGKSFYFYPRTGIILCTSCLNKSETFQPKIKISFSALSAMRHVIYSDLSMLYAFNISGQSEKDFTDACEMYIIEQGERSYKTLEFYKSVVS